jgi:hypothetical protein
VTSERARSALEEGRWRAKRVHRGLTVEQKAKDVNYPAAIGSDGFCTAHLLHRVAVAIVGGFLILFFLLRFVRFFAFFLPFVTLLTFVAILLLFFYVHFYLALALAFLFLLFWLLFNIRSDGKRFGLALWVQRNVGMYDVPRHLDEGQRATDLAACGVERAGVGSSRRSLTITATANCILLTADQFLPSWCVGQSRMSVFVPSSGAPSGA